MPIIHDPMRVPARRGSIYPKPLDVGFEGRLKRALTGRLGLTQFGVNLTTLEPGAMSSHRHWHAEEDEFVYVVSGELTLVTNDGAQLLKAGMVAGFPAGKADGHRFENRGKVKGSTRKEASPLAAPLTQRTCHVPAGAPRSNGKVPATTPQGPAGAADMCTDSRGQFTGGTWPRYAFIGAVL